MPAARLPGRNSFSSTVTGVWKGWPLSNVAANALMAGVLGASLSLQDPSMSPATACCTWSDPRRWKMTKSEGIKSGGPMSASAAACWASSCNSDRCSQMPIEQMVVQCDIAPCSRLSCVVQDAIGCAITPGQVRLACHGAPHMEKRGVPSRPSHSIEYCAYMQCSARDSVPA